MGRKGIRIPTDLKLKYAKLCYEGKISFAEAGRQLCVRAQHVVEWTHLYEAQFISSCGINISINSAPTKTQKKILKAFGIDAIYIKGTTQKLSDRLAYIMEEDR